MAPKGTPSGGGRTSRTNNKNPLSLDMISAIFDDLDDIIGSNGPETGIEKLERDWESRIEEIRERFKDLSQATDLTRPVSLSTQGLSRSHLSILDNTCGRQRFVTGTDPLFISVQESPTKKWLQKEAATVRLLVNGTSVENSPASFDRFQWLDDDERENLVEHYSMVSLELVGEIGIKKPGYVNILPTSGAGATAAVQRAAAASKEWSRWKQSSLYQQIVLEGLGQQEEERAGDRLWVTGFSLAGQQGYMHSLDVENGHIQQVNERTAKSILWPNESTNVPRALFQNAEELQHQKYRDALLVSDGFLVPGKDKGGLYIVQNPGNSETEWSICLTGGQQSQDAENSGWFYHRAVWTDLTGDGRMSILTARAKLSSVGGSSSGPTAKSQLVWLEMPKPHRIDASTGTPIEEDGTVFDPFSTRHLPWKANVLDEGPDVMFTIADLDTKDDTVEVIASRFFDRQVTLHSLQKGPTPRVVFDRIIDDNCGAAFGSILANLDSVDHPDRIVVDSGSTIETHKHGDSFSHLLVTSHECSTTGDEDEGGCDLEGGSLFAYRVPVGKDAWKTEPWTRTTVASGFSVRGQLGNMINPGAPGFVYAFHAQKDGAESGKRPLIAVAGDCSESAYLFRPVEPSSDAVDPHAQYKLMCEIECGATVGSIGVGYENFMHADQEHGFAKLYIPCFENDKILVFAMGSGEEEIDMY